MNAGAGILKSASGINNGVYKGRGSLYTKTKQSFIYFVATLTIEVKEMYETVNDLIRLGMEEADIIMCELCNDAVACHEARNYEVCHDCYCELGV